MQNTSNIQILERENIENKHWRRSFMREDGEMNSPFWNATEEKKTEFDNEIEAKNYGRFHRLFEKNTEEQANLNKQWRDKVPDDMIMMRGSIQGTKFVYLGCAVLYLLITGLDSDASPISPLREQIWPLVVIALVGTLDFLWSRQYIELRWHKEEMTAVIYQKGIFGPSSCFVESATKLELGDRLLLKSETTWEKDRQNDDEYPVIKEETRYLIEVHRNGKICGRFFEDIMGKKSLWKAIDFFTQKISK